VGYKAGCVFQHHLNSTKTLGISMGGSQLKQLKAAISGAGITRQSQPSSNSKKRKRGGAILEHREKRVAKLKAIHEQFNQFDVKVTKLKHEVGGRKLKGVVGKPTASKQAGIEQVFWVSGC
jgi:nucleolar protein 14